MFGAGTDTIDSRELFVGLDSPIGVPSQGTRGQKEGFLAVTVCFAKISNLDEAAYGAS